MGISPGAAYPMTIVKIKIVIPLFMKPKYIWPTPEIKTERSIVNQSLFTNFDNKF